MRKLNFTEHFLPHIVAVATFLIVTVMFFKPAFFENRVLQQPDIQHFAGTAKSIQDYREETGKEALWAERIFSGMPAYLVSVGWSNGPITFLKGLMTLGITHPINNIFLAFVSYYIMLLVFGVRPYLAIAGAVAFGLNSYVIIGLSAGHNARIGAIATMPLVMAGIHLAFTGRKLAGFAVTAAALALHFRDNHLQITYYLVLIVAGYGLVRLYDAMKQKTLPDFFKTLGILVVSAALALGTFFGQFWAVTEYTRYSIRGKSELGVAASTPGEASGLSRDYAFAYSNGILEPLTLLVPNFYGGSTVNSVLEDRQGETFRALQNLANSGRQDQLNQFYPYTVSYWGPQFNTSPYYAGAVVVFLFAIGIAFAQRKYVVWLVTLSAIAVVMSWGSSFPSFNYFLFDYLPGYNKFRSVTFTLVIVFFAMPLLGMLGLEKLMSRELDKRDRKKILIALASTAGLCLLLILFAGAFSFTKENEGNLPDWFIDALIADRKGLLRADAFRSILFILPAFVVIYFQLQRKVAVFAVYIFLFLLVTIDLAAVDKRYFGDDLYRRRTDRTYFAATEADQTILSDKSYFRVYHLNPGSPFGTFNDAKPAYYHNSIGGYHGAKLRRYQDLVDSCLVHDVQVFLGRATQGNFDFQDLGILNMLNVKYVYYGPGRENVIKNSSALGNAWFVDEVIRATSPADELTKTCAADPRRTAVIDASMFSADGHPTDSSGTIVLTEHRPDFLKYESNSTTGGLVVFSEIYYPKGWIATIDGKEVPLLRANYVLRALAVPAGKHIIEMSFRPRPYVIGNKVTAVSSWMVVLILVGSFVVLFRQKS